MQNTIIIMIGVQGSGKSTFCLNQLSDSFVRVNLDTLKTRHQENLLIDRCFNEKKNLVIDNTNPTRNDRAKYIAVAKFNRYKIIGYFVESKIKDCLSRNSLREGKARVPDVAVLSTFKKLQLPSYDEGFDELYFVKNNGSSFTIEPWRC